MGLETILDLIREIAGLRADAVLPLHHTLREGLGMDSLDMAHLAQGLEEKFKLKRIDPETTETWITVGDVIRFIDSQCPYEGPKDAEA